MKVLPFRVRTTCAKLCCPRQSLVHSHPFHSIYTLKSYLLLFFVRTKAGKLFRKAILLAALICPGKPISLATQAGNLTMH